jgi:uncharacterized Ntn-hydrolase superfamily protein
MTYTIIARCPRTGQLGIGIATYSLAVGGYCPFIKPGVAAVSSQASANPALGSKALKLLEEGLPPDQVLARLRDGDRYFDFRQVGIVTAGGVVSVHSGSRTRPWSGHASGDGFVAMGNWLAGERVAQAMAEAFQDGGETLHERLLRAIEAGRDAGGQVNPQGEHLMERSAALVVYENNPYPMLDLRVDAHDTAVQELRRIHALYAPYIEYYRLRATKPEGLPLQDEWARRQTTR